MAENPVQQECKYCGKVITGMTQFQLESLMAIHIITKHRNLVEIREKK